MSIYEYDEEKHMRQVKEEGRLEGVETGRKEGLETGRKEGLETGRKEGLETGRKEGLEAGIKAMVMDYSEEGFSRDRIIEKLRMRFTLSAEDAVEYLESFHSEKNSKLG